MKYKTQSSMLKKDLLHIHDAWRDINRSTPVLAKKMKTIIQKDTHTQMFVGALFIIAKI